jgi:hypothetical protein
MAGFKGFLSDISGKIIEPSEYVRMRITAKGIDGVLHEGEFDVAADEVVNVLPLLHSGQDLKLVVKAKRGRKTSSE